MYLLNYNLVARCRSPRGFTLHSVNGGTEAQMNETYTDYKKDVYTLNALFSLSIFELEDRRLNWVLLFKSVMHKTIRAMKDIKGFTVDNTNFRLTLIAMLTMPYL